MDLRTLLAKVGISHWDCIFWFKATSLKGNVLIVPDETHRSFIANCWLEQLREHISDLEIRIEAQPAREKVVGQRQVIWKAGKEPSKARLGGLE